MDLMEARRALLQPHIKTIGGLPVLFDNAAYKNGNGKLDVFAHDPNFFITGIFDTGSTSSKSYTFTRYGAWIDGASACFRLFNDLTAISYDYWSLSVSGGDSRTLATAGRFIAFTVYKPAAATMYMLDNTNQRYIFKGKNVT